jgi:predicted DNA binding CopG/RHH family protein
MKQTKQIKDIRFQIRIESNTLMKLKMIGKKQGVSVAKLIRQSIKKSYGV